MSEPFEIGATLALQDGIAEGTAAARHDIAHTARATRMSDASLRQLRDAGSPFVQTSVYPAFGIRTTTTATPTMHPTENDNSQVIPTSLSFLRLNELRLAATKDFLFDKTAGLYQTSLPTAQTATSSNDPTTNPKIPYYNLQPITSSNLINSINLPSPAGDQTTDNDCTISRSPHSIEPLAPRTQSNTRSSDPLTFLSQVKALGRIANDKLQTDSHFFFLSNAPFSFEQRNPFNKIIARPSTPQAAYDNQRHSMPQEQNASGSNFFSRQPGDPSTVMNKDDIDLSDNSSAANATSGTAMQGDVFLDGALLGRWVSRFLGREASRETTGPTGFDPRRSAAFPGPTIGFL